MPLIPVGTDIRLHRPPLANWLLIGLNVGAHLVLSQARFAAVGRQLALDASLPALYQYISYQFVHGDWMHLAGNMLFLWIFGNAVCDRLGSLAYVLFYLAGGVAAGVVYASVSEGPMVGASGAIAAVTTAFLVLFPRVHIRVLLWFFVLTVFEMPALWLIVLKIILWDNVIAPSIDRNAAMANVAYSAHLGGYAFGFLTTLLLLAGRAVDRNPFDLLAIWSRWYRRTPLPTDAVAGRVGPRPVRARELSSRPIEPLEPSAPQRLRNEVIDAIETRQYRHAAELYRRLRRLDPHHVLPRSHQLELANHLAQQQSYLEAVEAYEAFLTAYPSAADAPRVRLLVGLLCHRHLHQHGRAIEHLRHAVAALAVGSQRELAAQELAAAEAALIQTPPAGAGGESFSGTSGP